MKTLSEMSEMAKDFFEEHKFDLNQSIDKIQQPSPKIDPKYTPLTLAIENNRLDVIKELLDNGADINKPVDGLSPLMFCVAWQIPEAFEELLNHPRAKSIDFDYTIKNKKYLKGWFELYQNENIIIYLIRKTFGLTDMSTDDENFDIHKQMLGRLLSLDNINFNRSGTNPLWILAHYFGSTNEYYEDRIPYHLQLVQTFLEKGYDINENFRSHDEYQKMIDENDDEDEKPENTPISELFDFRDIEDAIEDERAEEVSLEQEQNLINVLTTLFNYTHVHLNVYTTYFYRLGTPMMIAVQLHLNNVIKMLCEEIGYQCVEKILAHIKKHGVLSQDISILKNTLQKFIEEHSFLNNAIDNADFSRMNDTPQEIHDKTLKVLNESVTPFVFSMLEPKKCLGEIIFSEKLKKEMTNEDTNLEMWFKQSEELKTKLAQAGFNLKEGFKQKANGVTLLDFAAIHGHNELILSLAIQPSFNSDFSPADILESLLKSVKYNTQACSEILFSLLDANSNLFNNLLEYAIAEKKPSSIRFFVDQYHALGGKKLKFNLLDPKSSYHRSLLSRSLKLKQCPYLFDEFFRMLGENGPIFKPNYGLQDTHLLMSERLKQYALQFIERHESTQQLLVIQDKMIKPVLEYYEYLRKFIIDSGFYNTLRTKENNGLKGRIRVCELNPVHITYILGFLKTPFDSAFEFEDYNLRYAAARDVLSRYHAVYQKRVQQSLEEASNNSTTASSKMTNSNNDNNKKAEESKKEKSEVLFSESSRATKRFKSTRQSSNSSSSNNSNSTPPKSNSKSNHSKSTDMETNENNNGNSMEKNSLNVSQQNNSMNQDFNRFLENASDELDSIQNGLNNF